jgi:S-adenosylmethionine synthetase
VPVEELALEACGRWLRAHLHALEPERHVRFHCLVRPGSVDLVELFERQQRSGIRLANDTSCGVGYAPHTDLEKAVLAVEQQLNMPELKASRPEIGEDVKVMGVRSGDRLHLTVACAFVGRYVRNLEDYLSKRDQVGELAADVGRSVTGRDVTAVVNTGDAPSGGDVYLTVTGTSAEAGDDGETGRGNRANGLITPYRPMTLEAVAGKNPVTHVGKLYNVAARRIAEDIVEQIAPVQSAQVYLVSQIGRRIDEPQVADVRVATAESGALGEFSRRVEEIVHAHLAGLDSLWESLVARATPIY